MASRWVLCSVAVVVGLACATPSAFAYRPFDGTDANVADPGEVELEIGYLGYVRDHDGRSLNVPALVANIGLEGKGELVIEGKALTRLGDAPGVRRIQLDDVAISFKQVHRNGVLQEERGPSVATECGLLLPSNSGERAGLACAVIASQHWRAATTHINASISRNRESRWQQFAGGIVEGLSAGNVRPVAEFFSSHASGEGRTDSMLLGLIWQRSKAFAFDVGVRKARGADGSLTEVRAGLTWSFPSLQVR
jgi:hypothetical protein